MAFSGANGESSVTRLQTGDDESLPIFKVERVQLQFTISADFVAAQVANNVLVLALSTGRILRIDLENASDIDGQPLSKHHDLFSSTD